MTTATRDRRVPPTHHDVSAWLHDLALIVLTGVSAHQAAADLQQKYSRHETPANLKLRQLAGYLALDVDRVPARRRILGAETLSFCRRQGWNIWQAAARLGITSCEVVLSVRRQPGLAISQHEQRIISVADLASQESQSVATAAESGGR